MGMILWLPLVVSATVVVVVSGLPASFDSDTGMLLFAIALFVAITALLANLMFSYAVLRLKDASVLQRPEVGRNISHSGGQSDILAGSSASCIARAVRD